MNMHLDPPQLPTPITRPPRGWIRWIAVMLALAGWWLSLDLAKLGLGGEASNPWLQSQCGAKLQTGGQFDCQSVLHSKWSAISLGTQAGSPTIPVALFGMAYFAFVGLWYLFVGSPTRSRWGWHLLIVVVVGCGILESVYMIHIMRDVLHKWCAGCLAAHAVNGLLALLTLVAIPWTRDPAGASPHPGARLALATITAAGLLFLLHPAAMLTAMMSNSRGYMYKELMKIVDDPEFVQWDYARQPEQPELNTTGRAFWGDPDAPHTVVVFIDLQCGKCMEAFNLLNTIMQKHPSAMRVDFRHFPLDRSCNDAFPLVGHSSSCAAARAAEAARSVGGNEGFRKMRSLIYARRPELDVAPYAEWAGELGLDADAFAEAFDSESVAEDIRADVELGKTLGITAAPAIFLDGRRLRYWTNHTAWEALLGLEETAPKDTTP